MSKRYKIFNFAPKKLLRSRAFITVILLLFISCTFTAANLAQGPKLSEISFTSETLTSLNNQRVVLRFNQNILEPREIKLTPEADFTTEVRERQLIFNFTNPLLSDTAYTIELHATAMATGAKSNITAEFITAPLEIFVLQKRPDNTQSTAQDKITRQLVKQGAYPEQVFSAPNITEFTALGNWLAVVRKNNQPEKQNLKTAPVQHEEQRLTVLQLAAHPAAQKSADNTNSTAQTLSKPLKHTEIPQPQAENLRQVQISSDGSLLGIKFFNGTADNLWLYTLSNLSPTAVRPVTDENGTELTVQSWYFLPGTSTIQLLTPTGKHYRVPFGSPAMLDSNPWQPVPNQTAVEQTIYQTANSPHTNNANVTNPHIKATNKTSISNTSTITPKLPLSLILKNSKLELNQQGALQLTTVTQNTVLYSPAAASSSISGLCLSPNNQFVLVRIQPQGGDPLLNAVEIKTGKTILSTPGVTASWCGTY